MEEEAGIEKTLIPKSQSQREKA